MSHARFLAAVVAVYLKHTDQEVCETAVTAAIVVTERAEAGSAGSAELEVASRLPWETSEGRAGWDAMRKRGRPPLVPAALSRGGTSAGAK